MEFSTLLLFISDPRQWNHEDVKSWLVRVASVFSVSSDVYQLMSIYGQYTGRELLVMGKKLFCGLATPNLPTEALWENLSHRHKGEEEGITPMLTSFPILLRNV